MWYFTVSSSNPALEGPNGRSLGDYLSPWLFNLLLLSSSPQIFPSSSLFFSVKDPGAYGINWHLNPEDKCLNKLYRVKWDLVEGNQKGMKVPHFCFLLTQIPLDILCLALEGSDKAIMGGPI